MSRIALRFLSSDFSPTQFSLEMEFTRRILVVVPFCKQVQFPNDGSGFHWGGWSYLRDP